MKVCFDTGVIIDFLGRTEDCFCAFVALDVAIVNNFQLCCCACSTQDVIYLMRNRGLSKTSKETTEHIEHLLKLFTIINNNESDVTRANSSSMEIYGSALIAHSCKRAGVELIVTLNKTNFQHSPVPAVTPAEFVKTFKQDDYNYELVRC